MIYLLIFLVGINVFAAVRDYRRGKVENIFKHANMIAAIALFIECIIITLAQ